MDGGRPGLVLGPMLRFVGPAGATVWVQTSAPCTVGVRGPGVAAEARTFELHGHHYALVDLAGPGPGSATPYEVTLDGARAWPPEGDPYPAPVIRVPAAGAGTRIAFGSCRVSVPHDAQFNARHGVDALDAYAHRLTGVREEHAAAAWPALLLMLGDQVYADTTSPAMQAFIARRRDIAAPPGKELADFTEYAEVYRLAWSDPEIRWLLSTVPTAMIFDDHDIRDDWNTSQAWRQQMAALPWWRDRIVGGLASYWVYQHLGNLPPAERAADPLYAAVRAHRGDAGPLVDAFAARADAEPESARWSYSREVGGSRLVVLDSRAGRVLDPARRALLDPGELAWADGQLRGGADHLLVATSIPWLLPHGIHEIEGWNEAVCAGAWGRRAARAGEWLRQEADLEHWAAFRSSFDAVARAVAEVALGRRGPAPGTVTFLSGDVHSSYLARVAVPPGAAAVAQAVCSPVRNELPAKYRRANRLACSPVVRAVGAGLARAAGVPPAGLRWRLEGGHRFANSLAFLELDGRGARVRWESPYETAGGEPALVEVARARLA